MSAGIGLDNVPFHQDDRELGRWLALHRCGVEKMHTAGGETLGIRIPLICQELVFDELTGRATCLIYETRPIICREYFCKRAQ
jgi:hypothetical protein